MKVLATLMAGLLFVAGSSIAEEMKDGKSKSKMHHMDNVYMIDKDGNRTAMCGCGMDVKVSEKTANVMMEKLTFHVCSEECRTALSGMDNAKRDGMMIDYWKKFPGNKMSSNMKKMATCLCGKHFEVSHETPIMAENGVKVYACSKECAEHIGAMKPAERLEAEKKIAKGSM